MTDKLQISLKAARVNAEMTQEQAARKIKVTKTTIFNWEKGKCYPDVLKLKRLCGLYGVQIDDIFLSQR